MNIVTMDYRVIEGKPIIYIFSREEKEKKVYTIESFKPYFFVDKPTVKNSNISYLPCDRVSIDNEKVWKAIYSNPKDTHTFRDYFNKTYEADVEYVRRWIIDNYKIEDFTDFKYRKMYIDIETTTKNGFPDWQNPQESVSMVTVYDNYEDKYHLLVLLRNKDIENNISNYEKLRDNNVIEYGFVNEVDLLEKLISIWKYINPDVVTGWNVGFDLSYIFSRCEELNVLYESIGYDGELIVKGDTEEEIYIRGTIVIDMLKAYKNITFKELPSYSLAHVTSVELTKEEAKEPVLNIDELREKDIEKLKQYNLKDVEVLLKLDTKIGFVEYYEEIRKIAGVPDINYARIASKVIDTLMLRNFSQYVFPTKKYDPDQKRVGGGYVKVPVKGLHNWVVVYDFSAMYPSIMRTFNLSYDTYNEKEYSYVTNEDSNNYVGYWNLKKIGIAPQLVTILIDIRKKYKQERDKYPVNSSMWKVYDIKQYAMKAPINAFYGVHLYPGFRMYKPVVGATITYLGRELNKFIQKRIKEDFKINTLYADTDSFFIELGSYDKELIDKIEEKINNVYTNEFVFNVTNGSVKNNYLKVEVAYVFRTCLLVEKRRYVGLLYWKDGKIMKESDIDSWVYKGVDIKRSNTPKIIKEGLSKFLNILFMMGDERVVEEIVRGHIKNIKTNNDISEFMIPIKITKQYKSSLPQQRAADFANENFGLNFKPGSKFYGVYTNMKRQDIIGFDIPERVIKYVPYINRDKYVDMFIEKIQLLYNIDSKILAKLNNQSSLDDYSL